MPSVPPVIIITGASRGIGEKIVHHLSSQSKVRLVLTARNEQKLKSLCKQVAEETGTECHWIAGDITEHKTGQDIVQKAVKEFGRIDSVIHNAGVIDPLNSVAEMDIKEVEKAFQVNLFAVMRLTQLSLPYIRQHKGRYVFVSSGAANRGIPHWGAYCCSKAALNAFAKMVASEEPDVICVAVNPSRVETDMIGQVREQIPDELYAQTFGTSKQQKFSDGKQPAAAISALALACPPSLNGQFVNFNETAVSDLITSFSQWK